MLHEIDQVLKRRLKWYEESAKRKVNYKRSLRLGALKWNYYALQIENFWIRYKYGIVWMLNSDIYIFFRWRKIQPSSLPWILYLRWQPGSQVFSLALNSALTRLYDACSDTNIPRGVLGTRVNPDTCGRGNFWIRKEIVADSNISGYVWRGAWMNDWMACHPVSRC